MYNLVKKSFRVHLYVMRILGHYPTRKHQTLYKIYAYFVYCVFTIPVPTLASVYLLTEKNVDLAQLSDSAFLICQVGCFIAKFVPFWKNSDKIRQSIYMLEEPIFSQHSPKQETILSECVRICRRNCWLNLSLVAMAFASWSTAPFARNMGAYNLPIKVWLPYDFTVNEKIFYLTYLFVIAGVGNGAFASGVIDPLVAGLAYQATAQLKILKHNLQFLSEHLDEEIVDVTNCLNKQELLYGRIKMCIKHHNAILKFVYLYEDTYSAVVFTQFFASVLVICNACLQLSMVQPFTYAFFAMVSFLSNTVIDAIYMGQWYDYDVKSKEALIILMERCKKPMVVTAGKILDLSLILRRAYSLLAVLKNY
ncbi:uncharacterized protein LOC135128842 [Zophobas morio]|uniref:uncharacterized protein LOC135128842 n=1 Tax=Zophobas morio TaxID=2755281 RepID=UPI003082F418